MFKKATSILLVLISLSISSKAQETVDNIPNFDKKTWHWGYYLGAGYYDLKLSLNELGMLYDETGNIYTQTAINSDAGIGLMVGLLGDLRINDYLNLRFEPGVSLLNRSLIYDPDISVENITISEDTVRTIKSTYVNLPVLFKFHGIRKKNINPYLIGGVNLMIDWESNQDNPNDNRYGEKSFRMNTLNLAWEAGAGIDWYLPYFKLTTEIRGSFGIFDEMVRDGDPPGTTNTPWTTPIDKLQTRAVFFVLKFE